MATIAPVSNKNPVYFPRIYWEREIGCESMEWAVRCSRSPAIILMARKNGTSKAPIEMPDRQISRMIFEMSRINRPLRSSADAIIRIAAMKTPYTTRWRKPSFKVNAAMVVMTCIVKCL